VTPDQVSFEPFSVRSDPEYSSRSAEHGIHDDKLWILILTLVDRLQDMDSQNSSCLKKTYSLLGLEAFFILVTKEFQFNGIFTRFWSSEKNLDFYVQRGITLSLVLGRKF
jgi:hypothetical protein